MRLSFPSSLPNLYTFLRRVAVALTFISILLELVIVCLEIGGIVGTQLSQQGWQLSIILHLFFPIIGLLIAWFPYVILFYALPDVQEKGEEQENTSSKDHSNMTPSDRGTSVSTAPVDKITSSVDRDTFISTVPLDRITSSVDRDTSTSIVPVVDKILTESIHKEVAPSNKKLYRGPFVVPKEGNNPIRSEDRCATNSQLYRYAVTDGVSRAFLSDKWAEIIAKQFVIDNTITTNEEGFARQLQESSDKWYRWATQSWIPEAKDAGLGDNWEIPLHRGPETTLIACSLIFNPNKTITINVWSIGDAHFFLFRTPSPAQKEGKLEAFPYKFAADFGPTPDTLRYRREVSKAYASHRYLKNFQCQAMPSDFVILATDALARWIFLQQEAGIVNWQELLNFHKNAEFTDFVVRERKKGMLEEDDTTLLIINLQLPSDI